MPINDDDSMRPEPVAEIRMETGDTLLAIRVQPHRPALHEEVPVEIVAETESFRGRFECQLQVRDFAELLAALRSLDASLGKDVKLEFKAEFESVTLNFTLARTGQLRVGVRLIARPWETECLSYALLADQTYLGPWISMAEGAAAAVGAL